MYEERIERQKLHICAIKLGNKKVQKSDGKVLAACFVRNLFGSLLCLSLKRQMDMNEVLSYPLTLVHLSLSHVDGSMNNTPKWKLMKYLESLAATDPPKTYWCYVFLKASSKFTKQIWWSSTISPSQNLKCTYFTLCAINGYICPSRIVKEKIETSQQEHIVWKTLHKKTQLTG